MGEVVEFHQPRYYPPPADSDEAVQRAIRDGDIADTPAEVFAYKIGWGDRGLTDALRPRRPGVGWRILMQLILALRWLLEPEYREWRREEKRQGRG